MAPDQKAQSSFIPHSDSLDTVHPVHAPTGIFTLITTTIFLITVLALGGLWGYKYWLTKSNETLKQELQQYEVRVKDPAVLELIALDGRLKASRQLLNSHVAVSNLLDIISKITVQDVRWTSFSITSGERNAVELLMGGQARSFTAMALQSDKIIADTEHFVNPLFSNISLDPAGNPVFAMKVTLTSKALSYRAAQALSQSTVNTTNKTVEQPITSPTN